MSLPRIWLLVAASLIITLLAFDMSNLDMAVQHLFYKTASNEWLWPKHEPILKALLYDGIKSVIILFVIVLTVVLLVAQKRRVIAKYRIGMLIVLLSMLAVPATVATLKHLTDVACPCKLQEFGGELTYVKLFQTQVLANTGQHSQQCFPAAHASAGFALISLFFLFKKRRNRRIALISALALGWIMGLYKMAIGDHFLSHTLVSMQLAWLISSGIAMALQYSAQPTENPEFSLTSRESVLSESPQLLPD